MLSKTYKKFDKLTFGKYDGEFLTEVIIRDPQYIRWALGNIKGFDIDNRSLTELELSETNPKRRM